MNWYQLGKAEVEKKLACDVQKGLADKEAEKRGMKFGPNVLSSEKQTSRWLIFLKQFQDFMVIVLLAATLISGLLGEYVDAIAIMVIVFVNGLIGYFQEQKAEKSLEKLKELAAPVATVLREGAWEQIPSKNLVPGDVVKLSSGDRIVADMRIIETKGLETEESALTGESLPVLKSDQAIRTVGLEAQDQTNMAFMGTLVTKGSGKAIVTSTGMDTVMGQIATLMSTAKKTATPLEYKLAELGKILIAVALGLTVLVVVLGIVQGHPVYNMFLAGVSLAVAAIPEGLPAIVTVALSLGVQRMIRKKAIVRKLSAVETLGCASVICSDKTGTLTENRMTVKELYLNDRQFSVTGDGYDLAGKFLDSSGRDVSSSPNLEAMLLYGSICNNAELQVKKGKHLVSGDPTDGALLIAARKAGIDYKAAEMYKTIREYPFDSDRKRMSVIVEGPEKERILIVKGAPDVLLPRCSFQLGERGKELLKEPQRVGQAIDQMASRALRTLAIAVKPLPEGQLGEASMLEKDLTFIGLYGMIDPPRKEVAGAVKECREAGIKTVMITGDHELTAKAIAEQIGILPSGGKVVSGKELNEMTEKQLATVIDDVYVFARVTPAHKLKIVNAFQDKGHIVAMTGDGVNDAPAIKASDIGISMGITGTDVTKEASSLVLMDDNFATIKSAIHEGRNIYENIRKFIRYLLASNVGEILVMLFAILLSMPLPLVPVQILWVNLVTDGLPAIALGLDQPEGDVMKKKPRNPREGIFSRGLGFKIISRGILIGIVTLIAFIISYQNNPDQLTYARTVAFATLVMAQLIHVFDCRSDHSVFARNPLQNVYLVFAVISSVALLAVVIYWQPLQPIFHTMELGLREWLLILGCAALPTALFGFTKK
ncbi:calcium-translocating P-type ATPase, SERCA-type [Aciduricibacillus chroicocephali]|uniref:Calcium-translocating P-type ATPase, SERCA-type n=1 Tax=Aciduricibacillus chroicocephali TaxID=3054939 RepID=A0ABY9KXV9_9BACI|nr:calcium-translocating P-type ATPase, SERCA-type [Bacillaceae bacterium 44XB]